MINLQPLRAIITSIYGLNIFLQKCIFIHQSIVVCGMRYKEIKKLASKLRNNPTKSEVLLWQYLRNRNLKGRKFLRQHPIIHDFYKNELFFYIPDFYCASEKLAIELDGKIHLKYKERDAFRDEVLNSRGIRVLRIRNDELTDIQKVLHKITLNFHD